jgi:hypothetical protein
LAIEEMKGNMQAHSIAPMLTSSGQAITKDVENAVQQVLCNMGLTIEQDRGGPLARALLAKHLWVWCARKNIK